jgi:hypothetical protein
VGPGGVVNTLTPTLSKKREENGNKTRNTRNTVGTRLDRVRNSLAGGPGWINPGRDPIGSLPCFAYLYIFDAPFLMRPRISWSQWL